MTTKEIEEKPKWLKKVDLNWSEANSMMKVAEELPNYPTLGNLGTYTNLGTSVLYLIAPLPEEELPDVETLRHLETSEL